MTAAIIKSLLAACMIAALSAITLPGCAPVAVGLTDSRDGKTYRTVKIGNQNWMADNLDYETADGSWSYVFDHEHNRVTLSWSEETLAAAKRANGRLYDWAAAMNLPSSCNSGPCSDQAALGHKGVCPAGWHLPTRGEWAELAAFVGGAGTAGAHLKAKSPYWDGTDYLEFSAMPGGGRDADGGFVGMGMWGSWWTATEDDNSKAYRQGMDTGFTYMYEADDRKSLGYSVRCVQD